VTVELFYLVMPTLIQFIQGIETLRMRRRMALEPPSNFEHVRIECRHVLGTISNPATGEGRRKDSDGIARRGRTKPPTLGKRRKEKSLRLIASWAETARCLLLRPLARGRGDY
jgi:hypothetical protein